MGRLAGREALLPRAASTCSPLTRQRLSLDLNHSLPLEDTAFSGGCWDGSNGKGVLDYQKLGRNVKVVPSERDDLRVLLPPRICYVVWKSQLPSLNLSFSLCKVQKGLGPVRGQ